MKAAFALVSLLPLLAAAGPQVRSPRVLPTIDLDTLNEGDYQASASKHVAKKPLGPGDKLCAAGFPFVCNGRCCPFNLCCAMQCCGPNTDFCGADGLCYVYALDKEKGFTGSGTEATITVSAT